MKKFTYITIASCISIILLLFLPQISLAQQESTSIGYAPNAFYLDLNQGDTYSDEFAVWNNNKDTTTFEAKITGFNQIEDLAGTATPLTPEEEKRSKTSAASWFTNIPNVTEFTGSGESSTKVFKFTINVPENVPDGTYRARVSFTSKNTPAEGLKIFTTNNLMAGPVFLIKIGDALNESLRFKPTQVRNQYSAYYTDRWLYEKPPVTFYTHLENDGETYVHPTGQIFIYNWFDKEIDTIDFNPDDRSLLNNENARFTTLWEPERKFGGILLNDTFAIGKIRTKAVIAYKTIDPGLSLLQAETTFWIIPWKLILILFMTIIVALYIYYKRRENFRQK